MIEQRQHTSSSASSSTAKCTRIRVGDLIDVVLVTNPEQIHWLNEHPDVTRPLDPTASWLHRIIERRLTSDLGFERGVLPVFLPRTDEARAERQAKLVEELEKARGSPGEETREIADFVAGKNETPDIGVAVQQWCGRLFFAHFRSAAEIYEAGRLLATWPSAPPWRTWTARLTGRLSSAKSELSNAAEGDPHCIHGTSIGMENVARTVRQMRKAARSLDKKKLSPDDALRECLAAPPAVLRGCDREVVCPFLDRPLTRRTIVIFLLAKAYAQSGDIDVAFLSKNWSACPARHVIPEMLRAVWYAAHHDEAKDTLIETMNVVNGWSRLWQRAVSNLEGRT
jgi:hypothetical protein